MQITGVLAVDMPTLGRVKEPVFLAVVLYGKHPGVLEKGGAVQYLG
jgi:hypothetical protein